MSIEKQYLRGKSLGIFISKQNSNVVMNDWWDGLVFMISVRKMSSLSSFQFWRKSPCWWEGLKFWFLTSGYGQLSLRIPAYKTRGIPAYKTRAGARAHLVTWNKPVPEWDTSVLGHLFLETVNLEFWKNNENDKQYRGGGDERLYIYLTWGRKEPLDIFNILGSQLFRSDMPNFQSHVFYFCVV